jgi:prepilin-type N-terminal cleavage/methylation domain-containing protein
MRTRRAYTLIEILIVMSILGILVQIGIPRYAEIKRRATAASIIGDIHAIRIAAFSYYTEAGEFPPQAGMGKVPAVLVPYLPTGFSFSRPDWRYRWFSWKQSTGKGKNKVTQTLVGVRVRSSDADLIATLAKTGAPGFVAIVTAAHVTFLVSES